MIDALYWANKNKRVLLIALAFLVALALIAWWIWDRQHKTEAALQKATVLTADQATNINYLQNALNESKQNAEMLAAKVKAAQEGKLQPVTTFYVQAETPQRAAADVADRINSKDQTLPPQALANTDRTLSVPQQVKQPNGSSQWQVGVYKVNNYRNWEWSAGIGQHGGDWYVPVELQRNFSKDAAASVEYHALGKKKGWEASYTRMTDKPFILF